MSYIITNDNITVFANGSVASISRSHLAANTVLNMIRERRLQDALEQINQALRLQTYVHNASDIVFDPIRETLEYKGKPIHGAIVDRLMDMAHNSLPVGPMLNFLDNLMKNPSYRAITELYEFLEKSDLPITEDGHFLAYKRVRDNYTDCHSGTIDNSVGQIVTMERQNVDDDSSKTCSVGLHAASLDYLRHFSGDKLMVLKINPQDVVSIPADYNATKLRCCRYEVISELPMPENFETLRNTWGPVYFDPESEADEDENVEDDYDDNDDNNDDNDDNDEYEDYDDENDE